MSLADQNCIPCRGGVPPMERYAAETLLRDMEEGWQLNADGHLDLYITRDQYRLPESARFDQYPL